MVTRDGDADAAPPTYRGRMAAREVAQPRATVQHRLELSAPGRLLPSAIARGVLRRLLARARGGTLVVVEGRRRTAYGDGDGPTSELAVTDQRAWSLALQRGSVGLGEAYVDALFDTEDLVGVLGFLARNLDAVNALGNRVAPLANLLARHRDRATSPSKADARTNVVAHYDVGDDFFELFLDPTMAYSCGVFETPSSTLEEASTEKFDRICRKLGLGGNDHVVEIGSGWGGFAIHAATRYGCRVTTTTISDHQFHATRRRVAAAGLERLVDVRSCDYRDLEGTYSHLVSIEMVEAVDWRDYDAYFGAIDRLVAPGGTAALQCILIGDKDFDRAKRHDDFLTHYIFPGGCLPSTAAVAAALERATTLRCVDTEDLGAHYVTTLRAWRRRLEARRDEARALGYGERFLRLWRFYLAYCEAAFAEGRVTDAQLLLARPSSVRPSANGSVPRT